MLLFCRTLVFGYNVQFANSNNYSNYDINFCSPLLFGQIQFEFCLPYRVRLPNNQQRNASQILPFRNHCVLTYDGLPFMYKHSPGVDIANSYFRFVSGFWNAVFVSFYTQTMVGSQDEGRRS